MSRSTYPRYVLRRIGFSAATFAVLIYVFSAILNGRVEVVERRTLKYDVDQAVSALVADQSLSPSEVREFAEAMYQDALHERGFDLPLIVRIHRLAWRTLQFDLGLTSSRMPQLHPAGLPVLGVIVESLIPTVLLFTTAFLLQASLGLLVGTRIAARPGSWLDRLTAVMATATMSTSPHFAAMLAILLFVFVLPLAPSDPWVFRAPEWGTLCPWLRSYFAHVTLPVATLVFLSAWQTAYLVRNLVIGTLGEDFVAAARGRGLTERQALYGHSLRTAAPPIVTMLAAGLANTLLGSFLVEPIFQWRGLGMLFLNATLSGDITLLMGILVVVTAVNQVSYLALDLTYGLLDPRIDVTK